MVQSSARPIEMWSFFLLLKVEYILVFCCRSSWPNQLVGPSLPPGRKTGMTTRMTEGYRLLPVVVGVNRNRHRLAFLKLSVVFVSLAGQCSKVVVTVSASFLLNTVPGLRLDSAWFVKLAVGVTRACLQWPACACGA